MQHWNLEWKSLKEVQCWTMKRNWWNRRYHRFPPKYNRISGRIFGNTIFYIIQQKSLLFNFVCNFLILKLEEHFFQKMFNYMKISKHNYWRRPLYLAAASLSSRQLTAKQPRIFMKKLFFPTSISGDGRISGPTLIKMTDCFLFLFNINTIFS